MVTLSETGRTTSLTSSVAEEYDVVRSKQHLKCCLPATYTEYIGTGTRIVPRFTGFGPEPLNKFFWNRNRNQNLYFDVEVFLVFFGSKIQ